jgi:hypothetical protein
VEFNMTDDTKQPKAVPIARVDLKRRAADVAGEPPLVIPRGRAQLVMSAALDDLYRAAGHVEKVAMAVARGLDEVQP